MTEVAQNLCEAQRVVRMFGGGVCTVTCELGEDHDLYGERHEGKDGDGVTHKWGV